MSGDTPDAFPVLDAVPTADERHAAHVAALLALPLMGPHRLERVLAAAGSAEQAWRWATDRSQRRRLAGLDLRADPARLSERWAEAAVDIDPWRLLRQHRQRGVRLLARGSPSFPGRLADDPEPPALLFAVGDAEALVAPSVAIVGTRRATSYGLRLAAAWGRTLSEAGVAVISGLASGIDAAAHEGALRAAGGSSAAAPVAVVGTGLDVVYPSSSAALWQRIGQVGLLLGEAPLGAGPEPWRFPARNRIIAGLADVVVVVESHRRGGSLLTVEEACLRQRPVLAVPGSVHSPASAGTLQLIAEGCAMATTVDDVLDALPRRPAPGASGTPAGSLTVGAQPADPEERTLLDALGWEPALLDHLVERTGWSLGTTCAVLERLLRRKVVSQHGAWLTQEGDSMSG